MQKIRMDCELGGRIGYMRARAGLTQEEMVMELQLVGVDLSRSAYAKIEAGIRSIALEELRGIKAVTKATWEELLDG